MILDIYLSMTKKLLILKLDSEIVPYPLYLGNISKAFSSSNTNKTGLT